MIYRPSLLLILILLLCGTAAAGAEENRFSGIIDLGFDSFTEKYSIVEEDTVDNTIEFRNRISLRYLRGSLFGDFFQAEAQSVTGNNGIETIGRIKGASGVPTGRIGAEAFLSAKRFWEGASYDFPNDYLNCQGKFFYSIDAGENTRIRISERLERMDFDIRNEFDYDYLKSVTTLSADYFSASAASIRGSISAAYKSIPDSSEISYRSYAAAFDLRKDWKLQQNFTFTAIAEHRSYAHEPVRSPYWSLFTYLRVKPLVYGSWGVALEHTLESYRYDTSSEIYFDYLENKIAALFFHFRGYALEVGAGPMYAFLSSGQSSDDPYQEVGGKMTAEFLKAGSLWFSMSYELGQRYYDYYRDSPQTAIFSDYFFNRFSLFANWRVRADLGCNGFISHEPRNYQRAGDDTSTTLFALDLSYYF